MARSLRQACLRAETLLFDFLYDKYMLNVRDESTENPS